MQKIAVVALVAACGAGFASAQTAAVTLDFEAWRAPNVESTCVGFHVAEKGFQLDFAAPVGTPFPVGFCAATELWRFHYGTGIALFANNCSASITLAAEDGSRFRFLSIDVQELNGTRPSAITFRGTHGPDNKTDKITGSVDYTVQLNGTTAWETVTLPDHFKNMRSVTWQQGDCTSSNQPHMFTRVRVEKVTNGK